jgi:hypothetical protein
MLIPGMNRLLGLMDIARKFAVEVYDSVRAFVVATGQSLTSSSYQQESLLKQEEMKTWKKIEDTRKRTSEIVSLKNRNEERIQKVGFENSNSCRKSTITSCKTNSSATPQLRTTW